MAKPTIASLTAEVAELNARLEKAREIWRQDKAVDGKAHGSETRCVIVSCCTTARRGWVSM